LYESVRSAVEPADDIPVIERPYQYADDAQKDAEWK
jgi:hypothetical protein